MTARREETALARGIEECKKAKVYYPDSTEDSLINTSILTIEYEQNIVRFQKILKQ